MIALDTNVLVYAVQDDPLSPIARSVLLRAALVECVLPAQVLAEFAHVCRRKSIADIAEIGRRVQRLATSFTVAPTTAKSVVQGQSLSERHKLAYFDALILAVAADAGAATLLSQDMQDGAIVDGVRIVNPFVASNAKILAGLQL